MIKIERLDTTIPTDNLGFAVDPVDSFYDALLTSKKSVIGYPAYGTDFKKRKHRALTTGTILDYKRDLKDACSFDPRLSFEKVELDLSELNESSVTFDVYVGIGIITGRLVA